MKATDSVIRKILVFLIAAILILGVLHLLEILIVGMIWFIVLVSLIGILLPTYVWTKYKKSKNK